MTNSKITEGNVQKLIKLCLTGWVNGHKSMIFDDFFKKVKRYHNTVFFKHNLF